MPEQGPSRHDIRKARGVYSQWQNLALRNLQALGGLPNQAIQEGGRKLFEIQDILDPMMQTAITAGYTNAQERAAGSLYGSINARLGRDIDLSYMQPKGMPDSVDVRKLQDVQLPTDTDIDTGNITPYALDDYGNLRTPSYIDWEDSIKDSILPGNPYADWAGFESRRAHDGIDAANEWVERKNNDYINSMRESLGITREEAIEYITNR